MNVVFAIMETLGTNPPAIAIASRWENLIKLSYSCQPELRHSPQYSNRHFAFFQQNSLLAYSAFIYVQMGIWIMTELSDFPSSFLQRASIFLNIPASMPYTSKTVDDCT